MGDREAALRRAKARVRIWSELLVFVRDACNGTDQAVDRVEKELTAALIDKDRLEAIDVEGVAA